MVRSWFLWLECCGGPRTSAPPGDEGAGTRPAVPPKTYGSPIASAEEASAVIFRPAPPVCCFHSAFAVEASFARRCFRAHRKIAVKQTETGEKNLGSGGKAVEKSRFKLGSAEGVTGPMTPRA